MTRIPVIAGVVFFLALTACARKEFTKKEFQAARDELSAIAKEDPREALNLLGAKMRDDARYASECHPLTHAIGHAAYDALGSFAKAMQYQNELCNSGYLHGIIEMHFLQSSDIARTLTEICAEPFPNYFAKWQCFHGVGHGTMLVTENEIFDAIALCETFEDGFARSSCVNGVFMENFNTEFSLHASKYVDPNDPAFPCMDQKNAYKSDCYVYAPVHFLKLHNDVPKAFAWCETLEPSHRDACVMGLGGEIMKRNMADPAEAESLCSRGNDKQTSSCIRGMALLAVHHFGETHSANELCDKLQKPHRQECRDAVQGKESWFTPASL